MRSLTSFLQQNSAPASSSLSVILGTTLQQHTTYILLPVTYFFKLNLPVRQEVFPCLRTVHSTCRYKTCREHARRERVHRTSSLRRPCALSLPSGATAESAGRAYAEPAEDASGENAHAEPIEPAESVKPVEHTPVHAEEGWAAEWLFLTLSFQRPITIMQESEVIKIKGTRDPTPSHLLRMPWMKV